MLGGRGSTGYVMRVALRTLVRRAVLVLLALLLGAASLYMGQAVAQTQCPMNGSCNQGQAYSDALRQATLTVNNSCVPPIYDGGVPLARGPFNAATPWPSYQPAFQCRKPSGALGPVTNTGSLAYYPRNAECPNGTIDDPPGCAPTPDECLRRNAEEGYTQVTTRHWQSRCVSGCTLAFDPAQGRVCGTLGSSIVCSGVLQYTGDVCTVAPGEPGEDDQSPTDPPKQQCVPAGGGQTFCQKPNGDQCYTASTGRQICWKPNETGDKSDADNLQKRNAGPTPIEPSNPVLPNGDTLTPSGDPVTTRTTVTTSTDSKTITTTTRNYTTTYGTSPGNGDQGEPSDGSGGGAGGGDDGDGDDDGSFSGGGTCAAPPACSGDPILCGIADQQWRTRCDAFAPELAGFDFDGPANDVQGVINAGDDEPGETPWDRDENPFGDTQSVRNTDWLLSQIDDSRFMSGSCPTIPSIDVGGVSIPFDLAPICMLLSNLSYLVLALAYFMAFRIMSGG